MFGRSDTNPYELSDLRKKVNDYKRLVDDYKAAGVTPRPSELALARRFMAYIKDIVDNAKKDAELTKFAFDKAVVDPKVLSGELDLVERARDIHTILLEPSDAMDNLRKEVADMLRISGDLDPTPTKADNP